MIKLNEEIARRVAELYPDRSIPLVFGEGKVNAAILLIGEAPGAKEAEEGRPFVGKAGKNLDEFLSLTGFERSGLYITNTVKFRPTRVSAAGRLVNRAPTKEEVALFLPFLRREIALVAPLCVVTLGNTALRALTGEDITVGEAHGRFRKIGERALYPIYHPASLIYNPSLREVYREDLLRLSAWRKRLDGPF